MTGSNYPQMSDSAAEKQEQGKGSKGLLCTHVSVPMCVLKCVCVHAGL